ncbi:hypothetical protein PTTG_28105 [Puccinia triticina 1-1 BBBD Race 1]|uniref:Uncharacterized protein n=1 Tax=Puccinia triticina (isolate 1-1 / race 1 (BBBD)) TaxID=630390 RepID=A0A180GF24_PUCT1|nr:hypothetical protein PTTG_28105 [Puccinia triticina 1-1 BBBD Race 1]
MFPGIQTKPVIRPQPPISEGLNHPRYKSLALGITEAENWGSGWEQYSLRKEEAERNYVPTEWESLTCEEQIQLAVYHAHIHKQEDIEARLAINKLVCNHRAYHREQRRLRRRMASDSKSICTAVGNIAATPGPDLAIEKSIDPIINQTNPSSEDSSQIQQDREEEMLQEQIKNMNFKQLNRKDAPALIPEKDTSKDSAMDLDIPPSTSSAAIPALPTTTGNTALPAAREISSPLEEKAVLLVREHIATWKKCLKEELLRATPNL